MRHLIPAVSQVECATGEPIACFRAWRAALTADEGLLLVEFELQQYWLQQPSPLSLTALYCLSQGRLRVAVTDLLLTADGAAPALQYARWVRQHRLFDVAPGEPMGLVPRPVPKPWGQEIWYSGVEEREVCGFGSAAGSNAPIPWMQAVLPDSDAGPAGLPLVLLKILDPLAEPVKGDLYFELHEDKREVYVVTHVDRRVWPDGVGRIRYGFDPVRVAQHVSGVQFREHYLRAVRSYEQVRRSLDSLPGNEDPPPDLVERELQLRRDMDSFTSMHPLRVGDVVVVPRLLPHALQHGVRTIEFQTPVYERKILSFAQRVLTQDHWDTAEAVAQMQLLPPATEAFECLASDPEVRVERIVDFPDFEVRRVRVTDGGALTVDPLERYGLVIVVEGELALAGEIYTAEDALLLPRQWRGSVGPAEPGTPLVFLLALPRV